MNSVSNDNNSNVTLFSNNVNKCVKHLLLRFDKTNCIQIYAHRVGCF